MDILQDTKQKFNKTTEHFQSELSALRSGRAVPALVEQVRVEAYDTFTPLKELAQITAPEPRLLVVSPWDKSIIKEVEKALQTANLGSSPVIDGQIIRVNLPALNEERRRELVKIVGAKAEEARGAIRAARESALKEFKNQKTAGEISEDQFFAEQKELQKLVDSANEEIKKISEAKEKELMTI